MFFSGRSPHHPCHAVCRQQYRLCIFLVFPLCSLFFVAYLCLLPATLNLYKNPSPSLIKGRQEAILCPPLSSPFVCSLFSSLDHMTTIRARVPSRSSLWSRDFFHLRSQLRNLMGPPAASLRPSFRAHTPSLSLVLCVDPIACYPQLQARYLAHRLAFRHSCLIARLLSTHVRFTLQVHTSFGTRACILFT